MCPIVARHPSACHLAPARARVPACSDTAPTSINPRAPPWALASPAASSSPEPRAFRGPAEMAATSWLSGLSLHPPAVVSRPSRHVSARDVAWRRGCIRGQQHHKGGKRTCQHRAEASAVARALRQGVGCAVQAPAMPLAGVEAHAHAAVRQVGCLHAGASGCACRWPCAAHSAGMERCVAMCAAAAGRGDDLLLLLPRRCTCVRVHPHCGRPHLSLPWSSLRCLLCRQPSLQAVAAAAGVPGIGAGAAAGLVWRVK